MSGKKIEGEGKRGEDGRERERERKERREEGGEEREKDREKAFIGQT